MSSLDVHLREPLIRALREWMPEQRWFAGKGREPRLRLRAHWEVQVDPDARAFILLVEDAAADPPVLYQVPVAIRPASTASRPIGLLDEDRALVDGVADHSFLTALYRLVTRGGGVDGESGRLEGVPSAPGEPARAGGAAGKVLGGEQSNTSIVFHPDNGAAPVICKVFRQVHPGLNPDIELQTALTSERSPFVPAAVGSVEGRWPAREQPFSIAGSLAFAQEFFPGVEDAWRVALRAAAEGSDFSGRAEALGRAVAEVHTSLARLFPAHPPTAHDLDKAAQVWARRLAEASAHVPEVRERAGRIAGDYDRAAEGDWAPLQRIHGDLHLGQVLDVPARGWVLLDFEGEPMRPIEERRIPDSPIRDVAGMLRSFDYVAGSLERERPGDGSPREWADAARTAFLRGYQAVGPTVDPRVLRAFELDKAVYEALYEARNRPDWLSIPVAAIQRLIQS